MCEKIVVSHCLVVLVYGIYMHFNNSIDCYILNHAAG